VWAIRKIAYAGETLRACHGPAFRPIRPFVNLAWPARGQH